MPHFSFFQTTSPLIVSIILFILIIAFYLGGHAVRSRAIRGTEDRTKDFSATNGMLLALLGLLLAFTFSMSNSRFDTRRSLVIEEANAIGTVILRTDIYPDSVRTLLRANLKDYVNARISFYRDGMNIEQVFAHYKEADNISKKIWSIAATYARVNDITTRTSQLIPALNDMIDITTTRRAAGEGTIPDSIMYFLFILCFCSAFLLGYDLTTKVDWVVLTGFATMLAVTVFTIVDLDRPRSGLINMDGPNQKIVELLDLFEGEDGL